jgi:hypothetical protein
MLRTRLTPALAVAVLCGVASPAAAVLCKYVDDTGHVTYSDSPVKGAKKASCFDPPPPPPTPAQPAQRSTPAGAQQASVPPAAGGLPNVDPNTQRRRDESRRKILEDELAVEERALAEARKALNEGEATRLGGERNYQRYIDRIQGLKDRVTQHERNVSALKQELTNLR